MSVQYCSLFFVAFIAVVATAFHASAQLDPEFYDKVCPQALPTITAVVEEAVAREKCMGASLLRLHIHDCFATLGGQTYIVPLGRRDSRTASKEEANTRIPAPFFNISALLSNFQSHGLTLEDLVILSGAHTIGLARCTNFRSHIYNDTDIDPAFTASLQTQCPVTGGDNNTAPLDATTTLFDTVCYSGLLYRKGLLHSDQELFKGDGSASDGLVSYYSANPTAFWADFGVSMGKMGKLNLLTGSDGEIRLNCRRVN